MSRSQFRDCFDLLTRNHKVCRCIRLARFSSSPSFHDEYYSLSFSSMFLNLTANYSKAWFPCIVTKLAVWQTSNEMFIVSEWLLHTKWFNHLSLRSTCFTIMPILWPQPLLLPELPVFLSTTLTNWAANKRLSHTCWLIMSWHNTLLIRKDSYAKVGDTCLWKVTFALRELDYNNTRIQKGALLFRGGREALAN